MRHVVGLLLRIIIAVPLALVLVGGFTATLIVDSMQVARGMRSPIDPV